MLISCFNINSIRRRMENLKNWLETRQPDVVCLQEIKARDDNFPWEEIEQWGYNVVIHGQKSYNGVAIISRHPIEDVIIGLPGDDADEQARYIEAVISSPGSPMRIASVYVPNGNPAPGPKYDYKLAWLQRLKNRAQELLQFEEVFAIAGDYNAIVRATDVYDYPAFALDALALPATQSAFRELLDLGLYNAVDECVSAGEHRYSFWDYTAGRWRKNHGMLIDHILLSPEANAKLVRAGIDKHIRGESQPSDHVPVWAELSH